MRTRCPVCNTVFRVTSEQLRVKAGKVRCGHCQSPFNAFDSLVDETVAVAPPPPAVVTLPTPPAEAGVPDIELAPTDETVAEAAVTVAAPPAADDEAPPEFEVQPVTPPSAPTPEPATAEFVPPPMPEPAEASPACAPAPPLAPSAQVSDQDQSEARPESIEESTLAAREAGLVAARELAETPAYNRWAAGTLSAGTAGLFDSEQARPARWPFTLSALLLLLALLGQLANHFRSELVLFMPQTAAIFEMLTIDVPLPRKTELVSIESSDLQSDNARGLLVLQATLRNRATFAQAWPALELTLTDTRDGVVTRRVLAAADYLPPGADPHAFAANAEIAIRLWVEAKDLAAAGYRLYLFYP